MTNDEDSSIESSSFGRGNDDNDQVNDQYTSTNTQSQGVSLMTEDIFLREAEIISEQKKRKLEVLYSTRKHSNW